MLKNRAPDKLQYWWLGVVSVVWASLPYVLVAAFTRKNRENFPALAVALLTVGIMAGGGFFIQCRAFITHPAPQNWVIFSPLPFWQLIVATIAFAVAAIVKAILSAATFGKRETMRCIFRIAFLLLMIGSWVYLCGIGVCAPVFIRSPMSETIGNLKHTEIEDESVDTWRAFIPISDFAKETSNRVLLLSTLMLVGAFGYSRFKQTDKKPTRNLERSQGDKMKKQEDKYKL